MEEDIKYTPLNIEKNKIADQRLNNAIEEAEKVLGFEAAHNMEINQALNIVKEHIIKRKLVCYGGTAMNALLPKKDKFYDLNYDLPDYDFFTYDAEADVKELVHRLKAAGFKNIHAKMGIHEGTKKILVNYIPIADITEVHVDNYKIFFENSKNIGGIHYANQNLLRMMMLLELSRPRGEVERWKKVYERLQLLNIHFPIPSCKKKHKKKEVSAEFRKIIYDYIFDNQRVVANIELESIYHKSLHSKEVRFNTNTESGNIVFYTSDLKKDARDLKLLLPVDVSIIYYPEKGDFLASRVSLMYKGKILALMIQETACHSYNNIKNERGQTIRIASLVTLITLHYSLYYFSNSEKTYMCTIGQCLKTFMALAISPITQFNAFSVECSGYEKSYPSLLRAKLERVKKTKRSSGKKKNSTLKKDV